MNKQQYYYLINNTIKKGSEMPSKGNRNFHFTLSQSEKNEIVEKEIKQWLSSLQPCEISESELDKVIKHYKKWTEFGVMSDSELNKRLKNPIDVTDIVEEKHQVCDECKKYSSIEYCDKGTTIIVFKQPSDNNGVITLKEKEVEYINEIKNQFYSKIFNENSRRYLGSKGFESDIFRLMDKCFEYKQPKQVDGEIEAVEFAEWLRKEYYTYGGKVEKWHDDKNTYTTVKLFEIFKNQK